MLDARALDSVAAAAPLESGDDGELRWSAVSPAPSMLPPRVDRERTALTMPRGQTTSLPNTEEVEDRDTSDRDSMQRGRCS